MRIGVIADNELNNDKRVLREIDILKKTGNEVFALCFGYRNEASENIDGIDITRIRIKRSIKNILFFLLNTFPAYEWLWACRIKRLISGKDLAVLHVHDLYMSRAARSGINRSGRKIPMILDLHENYPFTVTTYNWTKGVFRSFFSKPLRWREKEHEYLGYADRIIVLSDDFRELLVQRYPEIGPDKYTTLPNVPDLDGIVRKDPVKPAVNFEKGVVVVFYFGIVAERRGIFDALDVFRELAIEGHRSVFLIIGPVDKKDRARFYAVTGSEPLSSRVAYVPWIDLSELPAYLDMSDICIAPFHKNPQHESGVANKIFDYMLGKKPLIASDCRPQKELIEKYDCGIVYSDRDGMKQAIIRLSADPELRMRMGMNGYKAVLNEYNTGVIKHRLLDLYTSIQGIG